MERLKQLFPEFSSFWAGLKTWQKASLFAAAFLVFGLLTGAILWAGRTSYEPLFKGLDTKDQAAVLAYLKENNISNYRLDPAADAILLPRSQVYEVRLALAQEGLPKGSEVGKEIFDDARMGRSEIEQRINIVRAIEGELQRTISWVDAVEAAKVSIVIPREPLFLEQKQPSKASVMLRLKSGAQLGYNQIKAIIHLVARSVEGLQPDEVTIVDTAGRNLSNLVADDMLYIPDGQGEFKMIQREFERQREREYESKIRGLLEPRYGVGKVVVKVKVELDFSKRTGTLKRYMPDPQTGQGVLRSQTSNAENYTGSSAPPGGAPGTTTNIPGYAVNTQNTESEFNKEESVKNYEITTEETSEVSSPGTERRVTASVLLNGDLGEEELGRVKTMVAAAIGLTTAQMGDVVVNAGKFDDDIITQMREELRRERLVRLALGIAAALLVLACVVLTVLWWLRRRRQRLALQAVQEDGKHVPTIQEMLTSPDLLAFQGEMAVLEEQLKAYARNNPKEVANLVNEWISTEA
jgi:flagellar M-ring protein FliF